ncbi:hypothetical protein GBAR_LOCUS21703, partial [Geodia barretti]
EILQGPNSTTVFLKQSAVFTCETDGGLAGWRLNGTILENLPPEIHNDLVVLTLNTAQGSRVENLTIPAKAKYNGTVVQCLVVALSHPALLSGNATLIIQGPLSAVRDLSVINNISSVTISWTAPFSLDVTGSHPDIWYSVLIYNVTDENNPTPILCTDCINITETHYTFSPDYISPCHVYNLSVIPLNGAGQGEISGNASGYIPNFSDTVRPSGIKALSSKECRVDFDSLGCNSSRCEISVSPEVHDRCIIHQSSSLSSFDLCANRKYTFRISVLNSAGGNATFPISFTTYDIQRATTSVSDRSNGISMTGHFITNTKAKGCFIVLQPEDGSPDVFRILPRIGNSVIVSGIIRYIQPSTYRTFIHDVEHDGYPNESPAIITNNTVTVALEDGYILTNASLRLIGSVVITTCDFQKDSKNSSCILVYRQYGNETIGIVEYHQDTTSFPVRLTVPAVLCNYTFAVYGKNNTDLDERPIVTKRQKCGDSESSAENSRPYITVLGVSGGIILIELAVLLVLVQRVKRRRRESNRRSNMAGSSKDELLKCADLDGRPSSITEGVEDRSNTMVSQEDKENGFCSEFAQSESNQTNDAAVSGGQLPSVRCTSSSSDENRECQVFLTHEGDRGPAIMAFYSLNEEILDTESDFNRNGVEVVEEKDRGTGLALYNSVSDGHLRRRSHYSQNPI